MKLFEGAVLGRLTVVSLAKRDAKTLFWNCRCECGTIFVARGCNLGNGHTQSCGCLARELSSSRAVRRFTRHGDARTRAHSAEYNSWIGAKSRCYNSNEPFYRLYGGRGIEMCETWRASFDAFLRDMGRKPSRRYSLERINVDGNYEPTNCKWATPAEQAANRRGYMRGGRFVKGTAVVKESI